MGQYNGLTSCTYSLASSQTILWQCLWEGVSGSCIRACRWECPANSSSSPFLGTPSVQTIPLLPSSALPLSLPPSLLQSILKLSISFSLPPSSFSFSLPPSSFSSSLPPSSFSFSLPPSSFSSSLPPSSFSFSLPPSSFSSSLLLFFHHSLPRLVPCNVDIVSLLFLVSNISSLLPHREGAPDEESEHQLPKEKLLQLTSLELITDYISACDYLLYQCIVDFLIPNVLRPIPGTLTQAIRNFAKGLETWLTNTIQGYSPILVKSKVL